MSIQEPIPEAAFIEHVCHWANQIPDIRAMLLTSSRARPGAPIDVLSDYDVELFVTDARRFAHDDGWLHEHGEVLVRLDDTFRVGGLRGYMRLVLYEDGTKIDFAISPVALLHKLVGGASDRTLADGYRVLLDKDGIAASLPAPTYRAYIPRKPSAREYRALVEEFWWETSYVAKNIWRDEIIHAKYNLDVVMKLELLTKLLTWKIEIKRDWSWRPGVLGRGLKRALPPATWDALADTYVGADLEDNWQALFKTTELFRTVATEVGAALGFTYPHDLDAHVTRYLQEIRQLKP